jgi:hypothetical protein
MFIENSSVDTCLKIKDNRYFSTFVKHCKVEETLGFLMRTLLIKFNKGAKHVSFSDQIPNTMMIF